MDQPICMTETTGSYADTYYYHFDGLGSVVALSDSDGDTIQVYEYDVYGQVAASDPNHPNSFLFTGRRFDTETGLYYYRARYYNPTIGRFLQTDPIGYVGGMNWYAYCRNNSLRFTDPSGRVPGVTINPWVPIGEEIDGVMDAIYDWTHPLVSPDAPLISAPYTWDQGGAPDQSGTWGINDFFNWYRYGRGNSVDLKAIGLLGRFESKVGDIARFKSAMRHRARRLVNAAASAGLNFADEPHSRRLHYDFASSKAELAARLLSFDPLVVLGNDDSFYAHAYITATEQADDKGHGTGIYDWKVQIEFSMRDDFKDPLDLFDSTPDIIKDWALCKKYDIVAHWWWEASGTMTPAAKPAWHQ